MIGVMGPGEQATEADCRVAYELGLQIAAAGWILLTGGRDRGVMAAASRGAKSADGLTVGILPTADLEGMSDAVDIPILTDMGHARNVINVLSSNVVIACGMGTGTASEIALALKTGKPVVLLNATEESQQFFKCLDPNRVWVAETVEAAISLIHQCLQDPAR